MTNDELDDRLRQFLMSALDDARRFAVECKDTATLGALAELSAKIINFEEPVEVSDDVGFKQGGR